ncbi:LysM peptidoglycan-binding domain-containing protein [Vibrio sp. S9_S30]|uniref:LysM peptidoglycan-binding domain-containing protein n=1 Tax=Vibrio sp. S9_S30 TaxID=2720226 RepID=UPI0016810629|nr:LysM domain-containing protein [Vibrio sp. S9_S30]MBD1558023.1 LysM peptidoglycan-binding domain-containing protein [Vibrio sp. S9_S30]
MTDGVYIVAKGDTLTSIAKKHGVDISKIIELNPSLRGHPNKIYPGMAIVVKGLKTQDPRISKMTFNGKKFNVYSIEKNRLVASYPAISGLPPNAPYLAQLIKQGREELNLDTDYTQSKYQNIKDAGPIQEDTYLLPLRSNMPYDKSNSAGDGAGWGEGGWILTESFIGKLGNFFGGRFGFFLHHDGGSRGTAGCIGLKNAKDIRQLKGLLQKAQKKGQKSVPIEVDYK